MQSRSHDLASVMARIPAGSYRIGSDRFYPEEAPSRPVQIQAFQIDVTPVTNAHFAAFVEATGYLTVAEQPPDPRLYPNLTPDQRLPASAVFQPPPPMVDRSQPKAWWALLPGANWRHPQGPASTLDQMEHHPVVHVAYADALAYAHWAGKRLPSAVEWEIAARGGLVDADFAWGQEPNPDGRWMATTWQGPFPWLNETKDGWDGTSPVGTFAANGYGLLDMCGNVWEWTSSVYAVSPGQQGRQIVKGGSFLCADNYCMRYRPSALIGQTLDTSTCHMGFRCAQDG